MKYDEYMKGGGFWLERPRNTKVIVVSNWEAMIGDMIYTGALTIWRMVKSAELNANKLYTNSTPKLRKMMRG